MLNKSYHGRSRLRQQRMGNKILLLREKKYKHINQIYRCLREISRLAIAGRDQESFIQRVCSFLVDQRGYNYSWIALLNDKGNVGVAVEEGLGDSFKKIQMLFAEGRLPACCIEALSRNDIYVVKDRNRQCSDCPIAGMHQTSGVMSGKLEYEGRVFGVLTVSVPSEFIDNAETELFREVAADIGLALNRFEGEEVSHLFRNIVENLPQTFALISMDYRYLAVNELYAELLGLPVEKIVGKDAHDFFPEEIWNEKIEPKLNLCRNGELADYELNFDFVKHKTNHIHVHYYPYRAGNGEIIGIISHGIDITERKRIEDQLESSERRFRYLFETASDTISIFTEDGYISDINEFTCRKIGRDMDEFIGKPITMLDPNYSPETFREFWKDIPVDKYVTFETGHIKRDGTLYPVEISARKIILNGKGYVLSIARDITERKRDRESLLTALRKAKESDRLKSAFLANMSHEIRTPLNGILGFSSLMNDPEITPEKQQQYFSVINTSGKRLLSTINDLIDISRIEAGMVDTDITEVDPDELLEELYNFFRPEIEVKGLDFILEKDADRTCPSFKTDKDKLYAILLNLLKNAAKFTETGYVKIGYKCSGKTVEFYVKDSGIGIPADKLGTIFDRFVQADQSLTKPYEGSGLGLSISREYSELLGGEIKAESEYGKGASFYLRFTKK